MIITETKLDINFHLEQFVISGYSKRYRLEKNKSGGDVIIYIREDIPSKELRLFDMPENLESISLEINLLKFNDSSVDVITHQLKKISTFFQ